MQNHVCGTTHTVANIFPEDADGKLKVTKTERTFEFFTKSTVGRVG
jgi:hypothetical protein